jgi:hypothetical protein
MILKGFSQLIKQITETLAVVIIILWLMINIINMVMTPAPNAPKLMPENDDLVLPSANLKWQGGNAEPEIALFLPFLDTFAKMTFPWKLKVKYYVYIDGSIDPNSSDGYEYSGLIVPYKPFTIFSPNTTYHLIIEARNNAIISCNPKNKTSEPYEFRTMDIPKIFDFKFKKNTINPSEKAILSWNVTNVDNIKIMPSPNEPYDNVCISGRCKNNNFKFSPPEGNTSYYLIATNRAGNNNNSNDYINVTSNRPKIESFNSSKPNVTSGDNIYLIYNVINANNIKIKDSNGDTIFENRSGIGVSGWIRVTQENQDFTLIAENPIGSPKPAFIHVGVLPKIDYFIGSDTNVRRGEKVKLKWKISDAQSANLSTKSSNVNHTEQISPIFDEPKEKILDETTNFTLTARNKDGDAPPKPLLINVTECPIATIDKNYTKDKNRIRYYSFVGKVTKCSDENKYKYIWDFDQDMGEKKTSGNLEDNKINYGNQFGKLGPHNITFEVIDENNKYRDSDTISINIKP